MLLTAVLDIMPAEFNINQRKLAVRRAPVSCTSATAAKTGPLPHLVPSRYVKQALGLQGAATPAG